MNNLYFNKEQPLVSIAVITYNSSKYVLDTLESIKSQTYQNLEVIISDDCSSDNTVDICQNWIEGNRNRFVRIELITVSKNTGIAPNANRALYSAIGSWIKFIAGDDILFPRAIQSNMEFISQKEHEDAAIVVSSIQLFKDNIKNKLYVWPNFRFSNNIKEQLRKHLVEGFINAPGVFLKRKVLINEFKGFNEKYPMMEDAPLWTLFLTNGYKFHFNPEILIGYRIHTDSVSKSNNWPFGNRYFFISLYSYQKDIAFPLMLKNKFYFDFLVNSASYHVLKKKYDKYDYTSLNTRDKIEIFVLFSLKIIFFIITGKLNSGNGDYTYPNIKDKIGTIASYFCWILFWIIRKMKVVMKTLCN